MARFADIPLRVGDPTRAVKELNDAVAEPVKADTTDKTVTPVRSDITADPRFAGKSVEDIISMYRNLETHSGRLASQLGEARQNLNSVILGKRDSDLHQRTQSDDVKIDAVSLMNNPTESLDRYLAAREQRTHSALQDRLNQLEAQLAATTFSTRHSNAETITADPEFAAWCRQTPLRMQLASRAAQNDFVSADMLLTEWEHAKKAKQVGSSTVSETAKDLANRVALEGSGSGSDGTPSKRTFRRADLIALRQTDPDKYESPEYQRAIVAAYRDGRVVD